VTTRGLLTLFGNLAKEVEKPAMVGAYLNVLKNEAHDNLAVRQR
jgi:hypothetical protein